MSELFCINVTSVVQALSNEASSVQRTTQRILQEVSSLEADMLRTLSEQTSAEKSSSKTAADIRSLRAAAESEEMLIAEVQNELARLAVDALNTQGHNDRLKQALQLLDAELKDKVWRSTFARMHIEGASCGCSRSHSCAVHTCLYVYSATST
jgi:predicted RNase H-like nuclease (RuvC/YqgF family)